MSVVIPVILCGGSGTRLWPLSRSNRPKQFISLSGDHTLLEETLLRAKAIAGAREPICVTGAAFVGAVRQTLDRLVLPGLLLVEPEPRNTGPALCAAALVAMQTDLNAIIVALPADHVIQEGQAFAAAIAGAIAAAEKNWLVILGVKPRHASSALGYVVRGDAVDDLPEVYRVSRFAEKPETEIAKNLVSTGALWNAGIVVARAETVIAAVRKHEPSILEAVKKSLANARHLPDELQLNQADFVEAPRISFDNAVLERHGAVAVMTLDALWRDVGTWAEVAELYPADGDGNRKLGKVQLSSSCNSFVLSQHRLTVGIGLNDLIVVDAPDALLVASRKDLGSLREVVEGINAAAPEVFFRVHGVGSGEHDGEGTTRAHCVTLAPEETTRRPAHNYAARYWIVQEGKVKLTVEGQVSCHGANQCFRVPPGLTHSIRTEGKAAAILIEVSIL